MGSRSITFQKLRNASCLTGQRRKDHKTKSPPSISRLRIIRQTTVLTLPKDFDLPIIQRQAASIAIFEWPDTSKYKENLGPAGPFNFWPDNGAQIANLPTPDMIRWLLQKV